MNVFSCSQLNKVLQNHCTLHSNTFCVATTLLVMSKAKELFILGATVASCAIGYTFYKNNGNNQDQQEKNMKETLVESASSAMDMEEGDVPEAATDSVYDSRSGPPPRFKGYRRNSEVMNASGVTVEAGTDEN